MSLNSINVNNQQIIEVDNEPIAGSDNLVKSRGVINKFFDFTLLLGYGENAKHCLSNFRYFICKKPELISKEPRFVTIYNDSQFPNKIIIGYNDDTQWGGDNMVGHIEDDNYAFYYDWDKHNQSLHVNNYYPQSKIAVVASSYAQAFSNLLN